MNEKILREHYQQRKFDEQATENAVQAIRDVEKYLDNRDINFNTAEVANIKDYIQILVEKELNSIERIIALARYFYLIGKQDIYIYFTTLFGGLGVIDNIKKRTTMFEGEEMQKKRQTPL